MHNKWVVVVSIVLVTGLAQAAPNGLIVLLTDYGADSIYVGVLKGAMYTKNPNARIDSISNSIPPYDIVAGAYILSESCREYPEGTVFCCIVDPGVGTSRKHLALETNAGQYFVGPDNGMLWLAAQRDGIKELREADNKTLWREGVQSSTFHGRDVFGPVAAALAAGTPIESVGTKLDSMVKLDTEVSRIEDGAAVGTIIRADDYGNLVTNIGGAMLGDIGVQRGGILRITIGKTVFDAPFVTTYADVPEGARLTLIQSIGLVECAVNKGDLAKEIGEGLHASVRIAPVK